MDSAEESTAREPKPPRCIVLHVVSPSAEAQRLTFSNTPTSLTISELKRQIQAVVPSRPAPERQRLIYQGKALVRPEMTLETVLGSDALATVEAFTLHLVLPPDPSRQSIASDPLREVQPNVAPHSTNRTSQAASRSSRRTTPGNGGPGAPQTPVGGQHLPRPPNFGNFYPDGMQPIHPPNSMFSPFAHNIQGNLGGTDIHNHSQDAAGLMEVRRQLLGADGGANMQSVQAAAGFSNMHNPFQGTAMGMNNVPGPFPGLPPHPGFPSGINPFGAPGGMPPNMDFPTNPQFGSGASAPNNEQNGGLGPQEQTPGSTESHRRTDTVVREGQIPGGGQWRMVINQTTVPLPNTQNHANGTNMGRAQQISNVPTPIIAPEGDALANGSHSASRASTGAATRVQQSLANMHSILSGSMPAVRSHPPMPPVVYLMSSPNGYTAVLVPGTGNASGPASPPSAIPAALLGMQASNLQQPARSTPTTGTDGTSDNQVPPVGQQLDGVAAPNQEALQPQQDEAVDLLRILIPFGGHLWLIIRLLGFVYLFAGGAASWYRTLMLATAALFIFFNHTGWLRPVYQGIANPVRRHLEGLLRADEGATGGRRPIQHPRPAGAVEGRGLVPEEVAGRLLREREQQDFSAVRQMLRRVERAIALFIASLVPGVGEQQIAARNRAEAEQRQRDAAQSDAEDGAAESSRQPEQGEAEDGRTEAQGGGRQEEGVERGGVAGGAS